jgi:hypothetical protein
MTGGLLLEVVGYGGRLMLHSNPFNFSAFLQSVTDAQSPSTCARAMLMQLGISSVLPLDLPSSPQPFTCVLAGSSLSTARASPGLNLEHMPLSS